MYYKVRTPGMLDEPLVGRSIAAEYQLQPGILDDKTDRTITGMNRRDGSDG